MSYTLLLLTAYAIVRTVPSAIGQIGGKKKSLPVSTERARLCEVAMELDCLLLATSLGISGCDESVLANQSSRISNRVTGTQSLSINAS